MILEKWKVISDALKACKGEISFSPFSSSLEGH